MLILDEPTVGLDPKQIIEIRSLITELGKNHTVILSSHILSEIQAVCERVIVINHGTLIADGTPDELSKKLSEDHSLSVRVAGPKTEVMKLLSTVPGVVTVTCTGLHEQSSNDYIVEPDGKTDVRPTIFKRLADRNWALLMMRTNELSLEQIFLRLTEMSAEEQKKLFGSGEKAAADSTGAASDADAEGDTAGTDGGETEKSEKGEDE